MKNFYEIFLTTGFVSLMVSICIVTYALGNFDQLDRLIRILIKA